MFDIFDVTAVFRGKSGGGGLGKDLKVDIYYVFQDDPLNTEISGNAGIFESNTGYQLVYEVDTYTSGGFLLRQPAIISSIPNNVGVHTLYFSTSEPINNNLIFRANQDNTTVSIIIHSIREVL